MSKIFIVEDCTKCPNFIPCTSPKDFRVGCTKLGNLGSPLNLIGGLPIDCPLNDYEEPKADVLDKIRTEIKHLTITEGGEDYVRTMAELFSLKIKVLQIIDKYKAESEEEE